MAHQTEHLKNLFRGFLTGPGSKREPDTNKKKVPTLQTNFRDTFLVKHWHCELEAQ